MNHRPCYILGIRCSYFFTSNYYNWFLGLVLVCILLLLWLFVGKTMVSQDYTPNIIPLFFGMILFTLVLLLLLLFLLVADMVDRTADGRTAAITYVLQTFYYSMCNMLSVKLYIVCLFCSQALAP